MYYYLYTIYIINYSVWKEIALNQTNNRKDFRVWDYPIKEEYGQILAAIERTGFVPNRTVGFQMVNKKYFIGTYTKITRLSLSQSGNI